MENGKNIYSENTPEIVELAKLSEAADQIENELFVKYDVKRGLRDLNGKGVLTGLTRISEIVAKEERDGQSIPKDGELYFRGYDVKQLIKAASDDNRFAFEECAYNHAGFIPLYKLYVLYIWNNYAYKWNFRNCSCHAVSSDCRQRKQWKLELSVRGKLFYRGLSRMEKAQHGCCRREQCGYNAYASFLKDRQEFRVHSAIQL